MHSRRFRLLLSVLTLLWSPPLLFTQTTKDGPSSVKQAQPPVVRIGVAMVRNQSRRMVSEKWERDQLVRNLKALRKNKKKDELQIEAVPLEAAGRDDALLEAGKKDCRFVVVTLLLDVAAGGGVSVGVDGVHVTPTIIGNSDPSRRVAMDFAVLETGRQRSLAEGRAVAPDNDTTQSDESAVSEAVRIVALRVAGEIRKPRPPVAFPE